MLLHLQERIMLEGNGVWREIVQLSPKLFHCNTSEFEAMGYIFIIEDFSFPYFKILQLDN